MIDREKANALIRSILPMDLEGRMSMDMDVVEMLDMVPALLAELTAQDALIPKLRDALVEERAKVLAWARVEKDAPHYFAMMQAAHRQLAAERPDLGPWER